MVEISSLHLRRAVKRLDKQQLDHLLRFIDENIGADVSVARLSSELRMSLSHFSHRFKETLGVSPHVFVANRRVLTAARLLAETKFSLEEIAEQVGFSNLGRFRRRFRACVGCNPSDFRGAIPDMAVYLAARRTNAWPLMSAAILSKTQAG